MAKIEFQVVEVEKARPVPALDEDSRQAILALRQHPGMEYLLARLSAEKALLETKLKRSSHPDIRAVDNLQAGIYWAGWLEDQLRKEFGVSARRPQAASIEQSDAFKLALSAIEAVGE